YLKFLKPGVAPQAEFEIATNDSIVVRAYCNLHGLWKA
ncbi:MAG: desulfoferrodoxin, partial [FCB group bacterium]|nr:desulfoferrodoxin [FCB group bacterium]